MQVFFLKLNISEAVKDPKQCQITYFVVYIFARTERKLELYCKIKDNDLSFWVGSFELMGFGAGEFVDLSVDAFGSCWAFVSL